MEEQVDEATIEYPEAIGELGAMLRVLQDIVAPYQGKIVLKELVGVVPTKVMAGVTLSYDPRLFHHAIVDARQRAGLEGLATEGGDGIER